MRYLTTSAAFASFAAVSSIASAAATPYTGTFAENFDSMGVAGTTPPEGFVMRVGNTGTTNGTWTTTIPANGTSSVASMVAATTPLTASNAPTATNNNGYNAGAPGTPANRMLATSPTSISGGAIELELTNTTGASVNAIGLGYDIQRFTAVTTAGELPGYRVFYSLDNATTWNAIAALAPTLAGPGGVVVPNTVGVTNVPSTGVTLVSAWAANAGLLIRWVDDNATQTSPDQIIGLDNVAVSTLVPEPTTLSALAAVGMAFARRRTNV